MSEHEHIWNTEFEADNSVCILCGFISSEQWRRIMSEPLSKVLGLNKKYISEYSKTEGMKNESWNECIDELDQLSPDVNKLAEILRRPAALPDGKLSDVDLVKAQEIIKKMNVWIRREIR